MIDNVKLSGEWQINSTKQNDCKNNVYVQIKETVEK